MSVSYEKVADVLRRCFSNGAWAVGGPPLDEHYYASQQQERTVEQEMKDLANLLGIEWDMTEEED